MVGRYYTRTLDGGKIAIYSKDTKQLLVTCENENFVVAWMCIREDYERKIEIIERIMLCMDGVLLDSDKIENTKGKEEFKNWLNTLKFKDMVDYYKAIDSMYSKAMIIAKSYYIHDFKADDYFYR